jgi:hypothetical protein
LVGPGCIYTAAEVENDIFNCYSKEDWNPRSAKSELVKKKLEEGYTGNARAY